MSTLKVVNDNNVVARDHLGQRLYVGDYVLFYLNVHGSEHRMESGTIESLYEAKCIIEYKDINGATRSAIRECSKVVLKKMQ